VVENPARKGKRFEKANRKNVGRKRREGDVGEAGDNKDKLKSGLPFPQIISRENGSLFNRDLA